MNGLPKPAYVLSGPHLSGHRVILGYETLTDAQNAHAALAHPPAQASGEPVAGAKLAKAMWGIDLIPAHPPAQASETGGEATGAEAVVRDGQIVISVAVDALPLILSGSIATNAVAGTFRVTDAETFAKEVCSSLNAEKEDGTTRVHMMFDSAFNHAIEQGAEGVEDISEDEFEMEAARLAEAALSAPQAAPGEGEQS